MRYKEATRRIEAILLPHFDEISVRNDTLKQYKTYLAGHLTLPVPVNGREDFLWEEFYILGPGDKREYEELKRTRASYTDTLSLTRLSNRFDIECGLLAHFTRISDKRKFTLPLADFTAINKKSAEAQLLNDYAVWFVNYHDNE